MTHHSYHRPGITDLSVFHKQAERRRDDKLTDGEKTIVHHHALGENCNDECTIFERGYLTGKVGAGRVRIKEDQDA